MTNKKEIPKVTVGTNSEVELALFVQGRLLIGSLFPKESTIDNQLLARAIGTKVAMTQDEMTKVAMTTSGSGMVWDTRKDLGKKVSFTIPEINFLKDQVQRLDEEKGITSEILDLCVQVKEVLLKD